MVPKKTVGAMLFLVKMYARIGLEVNIMKFKKWMIIPIILAVGLVIFFINIDSVKKEDENIPKPVKIINVKEESGNLEYEYSGTLQPETVKKVGFKIPGKLRSIKVSNGQIVNKGAVIATLDTEELQMAVEASKNTLNNVESSLNFISENYEKMIKLYEAGGIAAQELDKYKLERDNTQSMYNNAKIDYKNKQLILSYSVLKADINGFIIDILYEEGEMIPGGYPVAVIGSNEVEVTFGLSQEDISFVNIGSIVRIEEGDNKYQGVVKNINLAPDSTVRTYETIVKFTEGIPSVPIGTIVKVYIQGTAEESVWIPLDIILNDGKDYVYVIDKENIAHKRLINIETMKNTMVKISGLVVDDRVVSEGFRNLREGDIVLVQD